ncbi:MAG: putative transcriptional regulator [Caulobacter sp.]|nr:putative transcriptional regulator [Caulobacter sp.]
MAPPRSSADLVAETAPDIGDLLREWRAARRLSQLDLSLDTGVSTRHLSCIETGKARPSRQLIEQLADALDVPLRERNGLLLAAGFAPGFRETALSAPELSRMQQAIELILRHQDPFPAFVTNRYWDVLMTNAALDRLFGALRGDEAIQPNILRQVFDPRDMRPLIGNWEEVARDLIRHLHQEVAGAPSDGRLRALLDEVLAYPDVPHDWRRREVGAAPLPVMTTCFRKGDLRLRFFSTITTFAAAQDVTLDEVRIESMFPADDETARFCRDLAAG